MDGTDQEETPVRVVVAPDSFKGSLPAAEVAAELAAGWRTARPGDELVLRPQADGGEGTLDAVAAAHPGATWLRVPGVTGPDGRPVEGRWLLLPDRTAVLELAQTSGLPLMAAPDPRGATSRGLGETMAAALAAGCRAVVVGIGGSASTDGGSGLLGALGWRLTDDRGRRLPDGGAALAGLASVVRAPAPQVPVVVLSDVDAPLLGAAGAAAVFGPQKGATPGDVAVLERGLRRWAELLGGDPARAGMGAAGGVGYGLVAGLGAELRPGAAYLSALSGLDASLAGADLLVTGEGRLDPTSRGGKVVGHLLALAGAAGVPVAVVAGQVDPAMRDVPSCSLTELAGSSARALAEPRHWLRVAGAVWAERVAAG